MNGHSQSLLLVWKIAEIEARHLNADKIEPLHLVIAICKAVDLDLPAVLSKLTPDRDDTLEESLREVRRLREVFRVSNMDAKKVRRQLRSKCKRSVRSVAEAGFLHRSDAARAVFADAEAFADFSTVAVYPIHLAYSLLVAPPPELDETLKEFGIDQARLRQLTRAEMLNGGKPDGNAFQLN